MYVDVAIIETTLCYQTCRSEYVPTAIMRNKYSVSLFIAADDDDGHTYLVATFIHR